MIFVEFGDRGFEDEIAACDLKLLHEVGGPGEQDAPTLFSSRPDRAPPQDEISWLAGGPNTKDWLPFEPWRRRPRALAPAPSRSSAQR